MPFPRKEVIERLRREFPAGTRVTLVRMDDVQAPPAGTLGTVRGVDDIGSILVDWDNGSGLNVAYGIDAVRKAAGWLRWEDLTLSEQEQARNSYVQLRADEEGISGSAVDPEGVKSCRFERRSDGYIYVDL